jgi:hypothetical protein
MSKESFRKIMTEIYRDLPRIGSIVILGLVMILISSPFAKFVGEPAFAPWGLWSGALFFVVALCHVIRRLVFHRLDLQLIAEQAMEAPIGAGLVFLGICIMLAALVLSASAMFRA